MEPLILLGFSVALVGLMVGLLIAWITNAGSGATIAIPGRLGMIVAALFGLFLNGGVIVLATRSPSPLWFVILTLPATTGGMAVPIALGDILRRSYIERMSDDNGLYPRRWGRILLGLFLLVVALRAIAHPSELPPPATPEAKLGRVLGVLAVWALLTLGSLWLIRSGTKGPVSDPDFSSQIS